MADTKKPQGWWHTLPGVLTALAAIITALTGLFVALHTTGVISLKPKKPARQDTVANSTERAAVPAAGSINLLAPENGGHLVRAAQQAWDVTIDGKDGGRYISPAVGQEAVFAFGDERMATFDAFAILVPEAGDNIKELELAVANETAEGPYSVIGTFNVKNMRLAPDAYQTFSFTPRTGRYLRLRIVSSYHPSYVWLTEFKLIGRLHDGGD